MNRGIKPVQNQNILTRCYDGLSGGENIREQNIQSKKFRNIDPCFFFLFLIEHKRFEMPMLYTTNMKKIIIKNVYEIGNI